jgi:2-C-methyl-D-erythritol 4-phosphate cytidylyltransferase / 2-C-methyl-D-erythritol 2,4-cyclodiphosphate synthase
MHVTAIIAAGGRGQRFGAAQPKQLLSVGGRPILERSVRVFVSHPSVDAIIVALPQELMDDPPEYLRSAEAFARQRDGEGADVLALRGKPLRIVAGGERRQDSVANAFRAAGETTDVIVIHDAARPFASADLIARTIAAGAESGAAIAAVQARDTVKREGRPEGSPLPATVDERFVAETLPRERIYLAQTPQAFRRDVLRRALEIGARQGVDATDEAALVELAGLPVRLVDGEAANIKITTLEDMTLGEAIAGAGRSAEAVALPSREEGSSEREGPRQSAPARTGRAGTGYDLHRLVSGRPLILGGVTIPSDRGALGHSDADVVCHAVTDAILGAAALGDIGRHFPDTDARWKDADSLDLLRRVVQLVADRGLMVGNVDVTVILETPKIRGHVDAMRDSLAAALGIDAARVSVKGKTNEGVDAIGRGEAIAAHAIALLRSIPNS